MTLLELCAGFEPDTLVRADDQLLERFVTVKPAMCGHNARLAGQIGDWTWEAVSHLCGVNTFCAADEQGVPTYLSFFYYQLIGDHAFHLRVPTFGDRLQVVSRCYGFGPESILTVHRLAPASRALPPTVSAAEMLHERLPGCLYAQTFNRWIQRGAQGNRELHSAAPSGFRYQHLNRLPPDMSPRVAYDAARRSGSFVPDDGTLTLRDETQLTYEVDMGRDLNGVGLLYFASYFEIADSALAKAWRQFGRSDVSFLERVVIAQRLLFLANADACTSLAIRIRRFDAEAQPGREVFDIGIAERDGGRVLAIVELCCEEKA
jgi:probable biosynthetic protein (TIGR04098 family)